MKKTIKTLLILFFAVLLTANVSVFGQANPLLPLADQQSSLVKRLQTDPKITAEAAYNLLKNWTNYPTLRTTGKDFTWYYQDPVFGKIPMRVYVPGNYRNDRKSPCILMLHGAAGGKRFNDIDSLNKGDDLHDVFKSLTKEGYIIIRPIVDRTKKFDWVVNKWGDQPNLTYSALNRLLISLKRVLNIDDNKIFAFGHSDGSDGATGLGVYDTRAFAGIVAYNSMLTNIFARDFYIRNTSNRSFYVVHSNLDDLRPMQLTREIINALKSNGDDIFYKEYIGYAHQDKHLDIDRPRVVSFMQQTKRNPFPAKIWWETNSTEFNTCDWLVLTQLNRDLKPATWYKPFNVKSYDKINKKFTNESYYSELLPAAAAKASYANNVFKIETSRVGAIEVKISPQMVDMTRPVKVSVNGKQVFNSVVVADKQYLINSFRSDFDRQALWETSINVAVIK